MVEDNVLEKAQAKLGDFDETPKEEPKKEEAPKEEAPKEEKPKEEPKKEEPKKAPESKPKAEPKPKKAPESKAKKAPESKPKEEPKPEPAPVAPPTPEPEPVAQPPQQKREKIMGQGYVLDTPAVRHASPSTIDDRARNQIQAMTRTKFDDVMEMLNAGVLPPDQEAKIKAIISGSARRARKQVRQNAQEVRDKLNEDARIYERSRNQSEMDQLAQISAQQEAQRQAQAESVSEYGEDPKGRRRHVKVPLRDAEGNIMLNEKGKPMYKASNESMRDVLDVSFSDECKHRGIRVVGDYGDEARGEDIAVDPIGWRSVRLGDGKEPVMPSRIRTISYKD